MTDTNSPRFLVARYLKDHGYSQTLEAFLTETDLPPSAPVTKPGDWALEDIIKEKNLYDQNLNFEKDGPMTQAGWSDPCPSKPIGPPGATLANGLAVTADSSSNTIIASFVNSTVGLWDTASPPAPTLGILSVDKNILSLNVVRDRFYLSGLMDGSLTIHDVSTFKSLASIKAHANYAVQVISTWDDDNILIATAGWDMKLSIHAPELLGDGSFASFPPHSSASPLLTTSNPSSSSVTPTPTPSTSSTRSATAFTCTISSSPPTPSQTPSGLFPYTATPSGRQSLAPQQHSTWASFTPAWLAACPIDPTLVAVATSHTPSMKLILVRLLFPEPQPASSISTSTANASSGTTAHQQAQSVSTGPQHAMKDELAIQLVCNTGAPQNDYSTPRCAWRPDGSGVWVSADDGVVRGVDAITGKVVKELKGGMRWGRR